MIVEGKEIAEDIIQTVRATIEADGGSFHLTVFAHTPNFATKKYLALKKRKAESVGITMDVVEFQPTTDSNIVRTAIKKAVGTTNGIVLQLPFPSEFDIEELVALIPSSHDVDALKEDETHLVLSPVVGACREILSRYEVPISGKKVLVVGRGRLVGAPAARWFLSAGAEVTVVDKNVADITPHTQTADIIVLGAGKPNLLTPQMVKQGVVILDAGTSEMGGELKGDADPACAEVSALFTLVPGGIGPITVALLLSNLVTLAKAQRT